MAERTRVVVAGFGRLGAELARGLAQAEDIEVVGIVRRTAPEGPIFLDGRPVPVSTDLAALIAATRPQVLVEASLPEAVGENVRVALASGVSPVIATTSIRR